MSQPSSKAVRRGRSANPPCGPSSVRADGQELGAIRHVDRLDDQLSRAGRRRHGPAASDRRRRSGSAESPARRPCGAVAGLIDLEHERTARRRCPAAPAWSAGSPPARTRRRSASAARRCRSGRACAADMERAVGHHQRVRGIAAEFEAGQPPRLVGGRFRAPAIRRRSRHVMRSRQASMAISRSWSKGDSRSDRNSRCEWRS